MHLRQCTMTSLTTQGTRHGRIQLMKDLNYSSVVCDAYISISSQLRMEEIVWSVRSRKSLITISTKIKTFTRLSR